MLILETKPNFLPTLVSTKAFLFFQFCDIIKKIVKVSKKIAKVNHIHYSIYGKNEKKIQMKKS